mmetsp:Transcript_18227/g.27343  ORF Transcript_18227/g.27343 Transcript_18227/m.27343 type:complete len:317 (+) Transcript_18227:89-1039(+)
MHGEAFLWLAASTMAILSGNVVPQRISSGSMKFLPSRQIAHRSTAGMALQGLRKGVPVARCENDIGGDAGLNARAPNRTEGSIESILMITKNIMSKLVGSIQQAVEKKKALRQPSPADFLTNFRDRLRAIELQYGAKDIFTDLLSMKLIAQSPVTSIWGTSEPVFIITFESQKGIGMIYYNEIQRANEKKEVIIAFETYEDAVAVATILQEKGTGPLSSDKNGTFDCHIRSIAASSLIDLAKAEGMFVTMHNPELMDEQSTSFSEPETMFQAKLDELREEDDPKQWLRIFDLDFDGDQKSDQDKKSNEGNNSPSSS